ncbi:sensor histidine kinase [Ferruginibacter albus]|uniref:sensor histidine kinase n=1 Tax=Ferruginibacter albus TaxID=2875540 RepID=UPI001CC75273|nr:HAMP domain-containing sensor histidine kinase [Ferruginibacter albus]UAY52293.1 hypothetical protein K9M53_01030 [Ferruginibacter albus]
MQKWDKFNGWDWCSGYNYSSKEILGFTQTHLSGTGIAVKAKLFGIISHDLRSPIHHVHQFLKLQQKAPHLFTETEKENLNNKLQTAAGSLLETMENLLLWSKTQLNQFTTVYQNVSLLSLLSQCLQLLALTIEAKNITIENNVNESVLVYTDPDFLQTIIRNLLQNAIKAAIPNSTITIDSAEQSIGGLPYTTLSITNEGEPFSQQQYEQIIANNSSSKGLEGLGLKVVDELSRKITIKVLFEAEIPNKTKTILIFRNS